MMQLLTLKILPGIMFLLCCWLLNRLWPRKLALMLLIISTAARCLFYEASMWRTATIATRIAAGLMILAIIESIWTVMRDSHRLAATMCFGFGIGAIVGGTSLAVGFAEEPRRTAIQLAGFTALFFCLIIVTLTWWEGYSLNAVWMQGCLALYMLAAVVSSRREHGADWWNNTLVTEVLQILALWAMVGGARRTPVEG